MILADTSIWVDHFRSGNEKLRDLLNRGQVVVHPFIVAELALGSLRQRVTTLALLDRLPHVQVAQTREVRTMIESRRLYSLGIGLIDAHLIASIFLDPSTRLWTTDKGLRHAAEGLGIHAEVV